MKRDVTGRPSKKTGGSRPSFGNHAATMQRKRRYGPYPRLMRCYNVSLSIGSIPRSSVTCQPVSGKFCACADFVSIGCLTIRINTLAMVGKVDRGKAADPLFVRHIVTGFPGRDRSHTLSCRRGQRCGVRGARCGVRLRCALRLDRLAHLRDAIAGPEHLAELGHVQFVIGVVDQDRAAKLGSRQVSISHPRSAILDQPGGAGDPVPRCKVPSGRG
jgi:hypothetical protein